MSTDEKIIRKYIRENNIYLDNWLFVNSVNVLLEDKQFGNTVYGFKYTIFGGGNEKDRFWYIPKEYFNREMRKYKLECILKEI